MLPQQQKSETSDQLVFFGTRITLEGLKSPRIDIKNMREYLQNINPLKQPPTRAETTQK